MPDAKYAVGDNLTTSAVCSPSTISTPRLDEIRELLGFPDGIFSLNIGSPDVFKCAYEVLLVAWDRTTSGYGYVCYSDDTSTSPQNCRIREYDYPRSTETVS